MMTRIEEKEKCIAFFEKLAEKLKDTHSSYVFRKTDKQFPDK